MDIRKLEIFVTVARLKSFTRAGEALPMSQPAVSIAIRKLEESLNCALFQRDMREIKLTPEGETVYRQAEDIIERVRSLKSSIIDMENLLTGQLSLACPSMLATYFLPDILGRFLNLYPGLTAEIIQAGTRGIEKMLVENDIELGVVTVDQLDPSLSSKIILKEKMNVCVAKDHPLSQLKQISPTQLKGQPMALYEYGYYIRDALDRLCADAGVEPSIRLQSNFLPLLMSTVRQGLACTVGLKIVADQEPHLVGIPLRPEVPVTLAIAWKTDRPLSKANQAFVDWLVIPN